MGCIPKIDDELECPYCECVESYVFHVNADVLICHICSKLFEIEFELTDWNISVTKKTDPYNY